MFISNSDSYVTPDSYIKDNNGVVFRVLNQII